MTAASPVTLSGDAVRCRCQSGRVAAVYSLSAADAERFWEKVDRSAGEDGCWLWLAAIRGKGPNAYGAFGVKCEDGKWRMVPAHRVAYQLLVGPVPQDRELHHECRAVQCVNTRHLLALTRKENLAVRVWPWVPAPGHRERSIYTPKPRTPQTHCKRSHEFTPENTRRRKTGSRVCRRCDRDRVRGRRALALL